MIKRIIITVMCVVMTAGIVTGCNLFSHDYESDYKQVIAVIESFTEDVDAYVRDADGEFEYNLKASYFGKDNPGNYGENDKFIIRHGEVYFVSGEGKQIVFDVETGDLEHKMETVSFTSKKKEIYKVQLINMLNSSAQQYMQQYNYTLKQVTELFVKQLTTRELLLIEADRLELAGTINWTQKDKNDYLKSVYSAIDTDYEALYDEVLASKGLDKPAAPEEEESTSTTYPIYPGKEEENPYDEEPWDIKSPSQMGRWPATQGTELYMSMQREAINRLILKIEDDIKADFRVTKEEMKVFNAELEEIKRIKRTQGEHKVYPMLGDLKIIEHLYGVYAREQQQLTMLQAAIENSVEATDKEISEKFEALYQEQLQSYTETPKNYDDAVNTKLVLYHPNTERHVLVKHILLQFSDKDAKYLENYKNMPGVTKEMYEAKRKEYVSSIVAYEHVNGEDDLSRPLTVDQVMNDVKSQMARVKNEVREAETVFNKLMYKYNQDPGIFNQEKLTYSVVYKLNAGESETYMQEFADAARELKDTKQVGQILDNYIITDYGIHIMYYADRPTKTKVGLYDRVSPGQEETYYDLVKAKVLETKITDAYQDWQNIRIYYYEEIDKKVTLYVNRYKDVYKGSE